MFIDASAIVAILLREPGYEKLRDVLDTANEPLRISPCVRLEATLAVAKAGSRSRPQTAEGVRTSAEAVDIVLRSFGIAEVELSSMMGLAAIEASARYGKIVAHQAKLNFGDCLAYGCATVNREPLLFVGADFIHTDIGRAG